MPKKSSSKAPLNLRCNAYRNPLGVGDAQPILSWQLPPRSPIEKVEAYEIQVASSPQKLEASQADLWQSGRVEAAWATEAAYQGSNLAARQAAFWRVRVWGSAKTPTPWSETASWEMTLLDREDWQADWIASHVIGSKRTPAPAPYLRHAFSLDSKPSSARLYITAQGLYDCEINGKPVTEDVLAPGWTEYGKRIPFRSYDVTKLLKKGGNAIGAILGDGWHVGHVAWRDRQNYSDRPALLAQLEMELPDGSRHVVSTGENWRATTGPILENDLLMGEAHDARLHLGNWSDADYDDSSWLPCLKLAKPKAPVAPALGPPVRRQETLQPLRSFPSRDNVPGSLRDVVVFDLGQNFTGRVRIRVKGTAGACIRLRYAEMLQSESEIYTANLRSARAIDFYTLHGGGQPETWEPRFTFHGFRYVELQSPKGEVEIQKVEGIVLHNEIPSLGDFSCSHKLINQLQRNIVWGQKSNFLEAPTDCPQRDERLGWTGDAQVFVRTASFNRDVQGFFRKWSQDLRDSQGENGYIPATSPKLPNMQHDSGPAWSDANIICPWTMYLSYGDTRLLAEHYDSMRSYFQQLVQVCSKDWIRSHPDLEGFKGFGDWLAQDGSTSRFANTPKDLIGTAYLAHDASLMAGIAEILGKKAHAEEYRKARSKIEQAFNHRYVSPDGLVMGGTQTSYILALHFDLLPEDKRPTAAAELVRDIKNRDYHLSTGFVGTPYLNHVLTRFGYLDVAYRLMEQETFPSWLLPVKNGATTMWERWDSWTPEKGFGDVSMNSFNHYAYGAIGDWLYSTVAGLDFDESAPGYRRIRFRPRPGGSLKSAQASLDTPRGQASISWKLSKTSLQLALVVPPNSEATLELPASFGKLKTPRQTRRPQPKRKGNTWLLSPGQYKLTADG